MKKPDHTSQAIRRRLFILLLRAFTAAVLLMVMFVLLVSTIFVSFPSRYNPVVRTPIVTSLETYYLVNGNWQGVEVLINNSSEDYTRFWKSLLLLDAQGQVVLDKGRTDTILTGSIYTPADDEFPIPIYNNDQQIATLVVNPAFFSTQGLIILSWFMPVGVVSLIMAIPTILIGLLLVRRFVTPLAEVIAAARKVASGDLSTRVPATGPHDLRALSDSFNHMAESLELNDRERRDLLADIAHELRTPLAVIRGRLEGIIDGVYPLDAQQVSPALEESYLLERLVEDLRLLTLAETRQLHFEPRDVSLGDLAKQAIEIFQAEVSEKGISLELEKLAPQAIIHVDPQRTEQVIGNLIGNALRYVPEGGRIRMVITQQDETVSLLVIDNGPGVPEEDLPHLFERFWRGEKSRSRASGGAGLGLAITRQLVEAQGGNISARNLPDGGLQISVAFPVTIDL